MEEQAIIRAEDIKKNYGKVAVLKGLSMAVQPGEIVAITGASGAGKTTLLQILGSLEQPSEGRVFIDGHEVFALKKKALAAFRNQTLGFVFQFHHLLPEFTALENICIPAYIKGESRSTVEKRAMELLEFLNLGHRAHHKPAKLSGGEAQRVAIARSLINRPKVVLADEPSGNLDTKNSLELHDLFFDLRRQFHQTFVVVTHDPLLAEKSDRIIHLSDGKIAD